MVYSTQEIIERAHHGVMDYIKHVLTLFTDFVAVLLRVLIIIDTSRLRMKYMTQAMRTTKTWNLYT